MPAAKAKPRTTKTKSASRLLAGTKLNHSACHESTELPNKNGTVTDKYAGLLKIQIKLNELFNASQYSYSNHRTLMKQYSSAFTQYMNKYVDNMSSINSSNSHQITTNESKRYIEKGIHKFLCYIYPCIISLLTMKKSPPVERVMNYIIQSIHSCNNNTEYYDITITQLMVFLLEKVNVRDKNIRYNTLYMIYKILYGIPDSYEITELLYNQLVHTIYARLSDKIPAARAEAIKCMSRFQVAEDSDDQVINRFVLLLQSDSNTLVRQTILNNILICKSSVLCMLQCMNDRSAVIRKHILIVIQDKMDINIFNHEKKNYILYQCLSDRESTVKQQGTLLLCHWLNQYNNNIIQFIENIYDVNQPSHNSLIVYELLELIIKEKKIVIDDDTLIPPYQSHSITLYNSYYWVQCCQYLYQNKQIELLDTYLPDTTSILSMCQSWIETIPVESNDINQSTLVNLIEIMEYCDFSDELNRRNLIEFLNNKLLCNLSLTHDIIQPTIKIYQKLFVNHEIDYIRSIVEMISEIRDPLDSGEQHHASQYDNIDELQSEYNNKRHELADTETLKLAALHNDDYANAQQYKLQINELQARVNELDHLLHTTVYVNDTRYIRILTITQYLLQHVYRITPLNRPELSGLLDNIIIDSITSARASTNDHIRLLGIKCLGLYCLLDRCTSERFVPLLIQVIQHDSVTMRYHAIQIITDMCMLYDTLLPKTTESTAADDNDDRITIHTVESILTQYLNYLQLCTGDAYCIDVDTEQVISTVVECAIKLLIYDRIECSVTLVSQLLLLYFHSSTQHYPSILQRLSVFWVHFVTSDQHTICDKPNDSTHLMIFIRSYIQICVQIVQYENHDGHMIGGINTQYVTNLIVHVLQQCRLQVNEMNAIELLLTELCIQLVRIDGFYPSTGKNSVSHQSLYRTYCNALNTIPFNSNDSNTVSHAVINHCIVELNEVSENDVIKNKDTIKLLRKIMDRYQLYAAAIHESIVDQPMDNIQSNHIAQLIQTTKKLRLVPDDTSTLINTHSPLKHDIASLLPPATNRKPNNNHSTSSDDSDAAYEDDNMDTRQSKKSKPSKISRKRNKQSNTSSNDDNSSGTDSDTSIQSHSTHNKKTIRLAPTTPSTNHKHAISLSDNELDIKQTIVSNNTVTPDIIATSRPSRTTSARKTKDVARMKLQSLLDNVVEDEPIQHINDHVNSDNDATTSDMDGVVNHSDNESENKPTKANKAKSKPVSKPKTAPKSKSGRKKVAV